MVFVERIDRQFLKLSFSRQHHLVSETFDPRFTTILHQCSSGLWGLERP